MESLRPPDSCCTQQLHQEDCPYHGTLSMQAPTAGGLTSVLVIVQNPRLITSFRKLRFCQPSIVNGREGFYTVGSIRKG